MSRLVVDVVTQLNALHHTTIRQLIVLAGVKGRRSATMHYPLANYVRRETGVDVQVGTYTLNEIESVAPRSHELSYQVSEFVNNFDRGEYPELDEA